MINLVSKYKVVFLTILLMGIGYLLIWTQDYKSANWNKSQELEWNSYVEASALGREEAEVSVINQEKVPIYICGEINRPGVYYVLEDYIVDDLAALAGGFTAEADLLGVNLARNIKANEKIYIPKQGEEIDKNTNSYDNVKYENNLVNINNATSAQLDTLPGIGETRAKAIIEYRNMNGAFTKIEDIKNVSGIGEKTFESLKDLITIE